MMHRFFQYVIVALFVACKSDNMPDEKPEKRPLYYESSIGMWYTVWWDSVEKNPLYARHWDDWTRVRPVRFGYYATDDVQKLDFDFRMFRKWGIDYLLLDDTNGHYNDGGNIDEHIRAIYKKAAELGEYAPKINIAGGRPLINGDVAGMQAELDIFAGLAEQYPGQVFLWKAKPLFVNYNVPQNYTYKDARERFTMRPAGGMTSEGWNVRKETGLIYTGLWGWVFDKQYGGSEVYGLTAGWSRDHNELGHPLAPVSRGNGKRYQEEWLAAVKANPEMIVIASWNDHAEECGIEAVEILSPIPGRETDNKNPFYYEQLTEGYLGLKTGYIEGFYYRSENENRIYRYQDKKLVKVDGVNDRTSVIVVPSDYYEWAGVERIN
jgi:hypothetical protein